MKKETMRRFTRPEVWLHWSQAVLYLLLFGSGTLLLIGRIFDHPLVSPKSLGILHRVAGVALFVLLTQALLLSIVADKFRSFWRTLGQCLRWRWGDVVWLVKVPLNAIKRRVRLPPADRFNAGQKLHVLVVVGVLAGPPTAPLAIPDYSLVQRLPASRWLCRGHSCKIACLRSNGDLVPTSGPGMPLAADGKTLLALPCRDDCQVVGDVLVTVPEESQPSGVAMNGVFAHGQWRQHQVVALVEGRAVGVGGQRVVPVPRRQHQHVG
jgi:hypothetical protein